MRGDGTATHSPFTCASSSAPGSHVEEEFAGPSILHACENEYRCDSFAERYEGGRGFVLLTKLHSDKKTSIKRGVADWLPTKAGSGAPEKFPIQIPTAYWSS
jgi:hypothetical protein